MTTYNLRISATKRKALEFLALSYDCEHHGKPSIPKLVEAIADGDIALVKKQDIDKECANRQNDINDSFYERLVLAIAQGLSANPNATDYSASHFIETIENRVNAYFGDYPSNSEEKSDENELSEDIQVEYP